MVLVVDDEAEIRKVIEMALTMAGHAVSTAEGLTPALARLEAEPQVQLVITDINMPGGSGTDLARAMEAAYPDVKLIYMSAKENAVTPSDPPAPFLRKPFSLEELEATVRSLLG